MHDIHKLGVFLNDEPGDDEALAFAGRIGSALDVQSVLCVHVRGMESRPGAPPPSDDSVRQFVQTRLPEAIAKRTIIEVHHNTGVADILRSARDQSLDLIVVGRRLPHDQLAVGSAFSRLARKAPCSVLVVPDQAHPHFGRIVVPVDGSEHSKLALITAIALARRSKEPNPQVIVQSIYEVGYGYQYSDQSFADAVRSREESARKRLDDFLADVDHAGVLFTTICTCSNHPNAAVYDLVASKNLDLVAVGSRGLSHTAAALIGSFAERLLAASPVPVLVVKKKGETLRFLEALFTS